MDEDRFAEIVEGTFHRLPPKFQEAIENLGVFIEDVPGPEIVASLRLRSRRDLLGLYQGVPLPQRGSWYGMTATPPDKISLYRLNIERVCRNDEEVEEKIYEVLLHEIGHYFGMSEEEIRAAGY